MNIEGRGVERGAGLQGELHGRCVIWITWEDHRRSRELAAHLGVPLFAYVSQRPYPLRVVQLTVRTLRLFVSVRPDLIVVQNPSIVLTTLACALRRALKYKVVVDRHSNFKQQELGNRSLKWRTFHFLSKYTVRAADVTIVTNETLSELVKSWGGRGFVLPDKIPTLSVCSGRSLADKPTIALISSHAADEPLKEALQAAALAEDLNFYITGHPARTVAAFPDLLRDNVHLTGYLPEAEYQSLLASADAVMTLTTAPNTLLCGAYEAVAMGKPLIISDQEALTRYFYKGTVVAQNTPRSLAEAARRAVSERPRLSTEMRDLRGELSEFWAARWDRFLETLRLLLQTGGHN